MPSHRPQQFPNTLLRWNIILITCTNLPFSITATLSPPPNRDQLFKDNAPQYIQAVLEYLYLNPNGYDEPTVDNFDQYLHSTHLPVRDEELDDFDEEHLDDIAQIEPDFPYPDF